MHIDRNGNEIHIGDHLYYYRFRGNPVEVVGIAEKGIYVDNNLGIYPPSYSYKNIQRIQEMLLVKKEDNNMRKYGTGEVIPEPTPETDEITFTNEDRVKLEKENTDADTEED